MSGVLRLPFMIQPNLNEAMMTLGISTDLFLEIHVLLSLIGIVSGIIVLYGLVTGTSSGGWTALFLATTILTSATGFPLPPFGFDPPRAVGVLSLLLLAIVIVALYKFRLVGPWRWTYIGTAVTALYLNSFVGVIQAFSKLSFLHSLAPTQSEPPFLIAQIIVLVAFVVLDVTAVSRFHPKAVTRMYEPPYPRRFAV
jgi:hypothetical protein